MKDLNRSARHRRVTIELTDGRTRTGDRLSASGDSVSWYDVDRVSGRYAVPTSQVHKVSIKERGRGTGRGALWGLVAGGVLLGSLAAAASSDTEFGWVYGALLGGGLGGAIGAGLGAVVGFFMGDSEDYIFESRPGDVAGEPESPKRSSEGG